MPMANNLHDWHEMVNGLHNWHASGVIGSLDSLDMCQQAKLDKALTSWSIGMPPVLLAHFTNWK
jgi:hypothetical protein